MGSAFAAGALDKLEEWARELAWSDILGFMDVTLPRSGLIEGDRIAKPAHRIFGQYSKVE